MSQVVGQDMVTGMGFIGLEPGRVYQMGTAVKKTVSGNPIVLADSLAKPFAGLSVHGWSRQKSTTGAQLFDASKLASAAIGNVTITNNSDGSFTVSGDGTATANVNYTHTYSTEESLKLLKAGTLFLKVGKTYPHCDVLIITDTQTMELLGVRDLVSKEIPEDIFNDSTFRMRIRFYINGGETIIPGTIKPMLYQSGDGTWEPYTGGKPSPSLDYPQEIVSAGDDGDVEVSVTGSNLFDVNTKVDNKALVWKTGLLNTETKSVASDYIPIEIGQYSMNYKAQILWYDANKNFLGDAKQSEYDTFEIADETVKYVRLGFRTGSNGNVDMTTVTDIMVNKGTEVLPYEPYKYPQSVIISTPNGLPGIPVTSGGNYTDEDGQQWICDEIDLARGVRRSWVWSYTLDGSEVWQKYTNNNGFALLSFLPFSAFGREGLCNQLPITRVNSTIESIWLGVSSKNLYCVKSSFYDDTLEDKGLSNWKAHLAENPLVVMTYLDEPIETTLSQEEIAAYKALRTYKGTTVVSNDADCHMEVTYRAKKG